MSKHIPEAVIDQHIAGHEWLDRQGEELRAFASAVLDQVVQDDPKFYALLTEAYGPRKVAP